MRHKELFTTKPGGRQSLFVSKSRNELARQEFHILDEDGGEIEMTGSELISLCRQFSDYAASQDAMFEDDDSLVVCLMVEGGAVFQGRIGKIEDGGDFE